MGSAFAYQIYDIFWSDDQRPKAIKILGSCTGGFIAYKFFVAMDLFQKRDELKKKLKETKSSSEAGFLRVELKKIENELSSRQITMVAAAIGSILAQFWLYMAIKTRLINVSWSDLSELFHPAPPPPQPAPAPSHPTFSPEISGTSAMPKETLEWFTKLQGHENDVSKLDEEIKTIKPKIGKLEKMTSLNTTEKDELERLKRYQASVDALSKSEDICPVTQDQFNRTFPDGSICIPTRKTILNCGHFLSLAIAKTFWEQKKYCPLCNKKQPITTITVVHG